jgi:hypothetical protein
LSQGFVLFWHRYGNTRAGVDTVRRLAQNQRELCGQRIEQGVELDLKWAAADGASLLYAYHGPTGRQRLSAKAALRQSEAGAVMTLESLFAHPQARALHYLVEIKCGVGSPLAALRALGALVDRFELGDRVRLAASSLSMLVAAQDAAPALRRILFGRSVGDDAILHKPTTYIRQSLWQHGLLVRARNDTIQDLCPLGLFPASARAHAQAAADAQARGLGYLAGRVTTEATLRALAGSGHTAAFVYGRPEKLFV